MPRRSPIGRSADIPILRRERLDHPLGLMPVPSLRIEEALDRALVGFGIMPQRLDSPASRILP